MATAKYSGEEIEVEYSCRLEKSDYGVRGSPVWDEVEDLEIETVTILGVEIDHKKLGEEFEARLLELADDLEWER